MEKLEIMIKLASEKNIDQVLLEFKEYAQEVDVDFVRKVCKLCICSRLTDATTATDKAVSCISSIACTLLISSLPHLMLGVEWPYYLPMGPYVCVHLLQAVRAIGRCAVSLEKAAQRCISVLLELIQTKVNYVVQEAVIVIKVRE